MSRNFRRSVLHQGAVMSDRAADFTGSIPAFYDHGLGPVFFADFADDIARRAAATAPRRVLEIAAGTGIVTRRLRDVLPPEAHLIATDLNLPMLEVASGKISPRRESRVPARRCPGPALPGFQLRCGCLSVRSHVLPGQG